MWRSKQMPEQVAKVTSWRAFARDCQNGTPSTRVLGVIARCRRTSTGTLPCVRAAGRCGPLLVTSTSCTHLCSRANVYTHARTHARPRAAAGAVLLQRASSEALAGGTPQSMRQESISSILLNNVAAVLLSFRVLTSFGLFFPLLHLCVIFDSDTLEVYTHRTNFC